MFQKAWRFLEKLFEDELTYFASSLSFYTIFSLIPLMMIGMSIITSLPSFKSNYEQIKTFLLNNVIPVRGEQLSGYIDMFLQNSSTMGVFGIVYALFASAMFFDNYEYVVAKIFKVRKKSIWSMLSTYWTFITLMPIALGIAIYISTYLQTFTGFDLFQIFPYLIVWATFFVGYKISTTEVILYKAVFISSFISSGIWYITKLLFVYYVMYNKAYTSLYGSFSVLLFFFLWLYVSWIIYLYGLKMCAILQDRYKGDDDVTQEG